MKIRPLADKVLVQRLEAENKTAGGIVLPDTAKETTKGKDSQRRGGQAARRRHEKEDAGQEGGCSAFYKLCRHRREDRRQRVFDYGRVRYHGSN